MKFLQVILIASTLICFAVGQEDPFAAFNKMMSTATPMDQPPENNEAPAQPPADAQPPVEAQPEEPAASSNPEPVPDPPKSDPTTQPPASATTAKPPMSVTTMRIETTTNSVTRLAISLFLLSAASMAAFI